MNTLIRLLLVVFVATQISARNGEWEKFKSQFGRHYSNAKEEQHRFKIFSDNLRIIKEHNERHDKGEVTFTLGVNQFADMTSAEFTEKMTGLTKTKRGQTTHSADCTEPDSIDWRDNGAVTPVKDEGQCGSVVTFSATGALEGANFVKTGQLVSLSEQNIQDCCTSFGIGCDGGIGTADDAFQCIIDIGGIAAEGDYTEGECAFPSGNAAGTCSSYVDIVSGSEDDLKLAVGCFGPVAADIDASQVSFQLYTGGVYYDESCSSTELNHAVLIVGYGTDGGNDYWLAKNSWGTNWGIEGYIELARNRDNNCGVATQASYPIA